VKIVEKINGPDHPNMVGILGELEQVVKDLKKLENPTNVIRLSESDFDSDNYIDFDSDSD
jgi:hypothetical protein